MERPSAQNSPMKSAPNYKIEFCVLLNLLVTTSKKKTNEILWRDIHEYYRRQWENEQSLSGIVEDLKQKNVLIVLIRRLKQQILYFIYHFIHPSLSFSRE